jgi:CO/xanthine dehydrogenase FAD-binding subunit
MIKEYYQPLKITEALTLLATESGSLRVLAGGTDLLINIRNGEIGSDGIVDLSKIEELKTIELEGNILAIGALVTFTELAEHPLVKKLIPVLASGAEVVGSPQIRNRGTVGGNVANASPAADLVPVLVALDGVAVIAKEGSFRKVPIAELIVGPYKTSLEPAEIITRIEVTIPQQGTSMSFHKVGRRNALAIARLNGVCLLKLQGQAIEDVSLVIGSATPTPHRFKEVEDFLLDKKLSEELFKEAGRLAKEHVKAITGVRASSHYKLPVIESLTARLLREAWKGGKADE